MTEDLSPVQFLLLSIASCFALSCRAELRRRKLSAIAFEVAVVGGKQIGAVENLMQQISIVAIFAGGITEPLAHEITERSKRVCTITNTLLDSPEIEFHSRATGQRHSSPRESPVQHSVR